VVKYLPPQTNTTTVAAKSRTASKKLFPHSHLPILIRPHGTTAFAPSGGRPMVGGHADDEMSSSPTSATPSAAGDGGLPM
jgi:hypothetical protein